MFSDCCLLACRLCDRQSALFLSSM
uniref:Uncharacterized protein n=1 Tax=Anguilla anguilla TaxID=7936 RepID=A0A0E9QWY2_ANGAN